MIKFPCLAFKENRIILSKEELVDKLNENNSIGKSCEVSFYSFSIWMNSSPVPESIIIDKVIYTGTLEELEKLAEKKYKLGFNSTLIYDGDEYLLFVEELQNSLEELLQIKEPRLEVITDINKKFVFPGYRNLKTGKMSKIIKKWRTNG